MTIILIRTMGVQKRVKLNMAGSALLLGSLAILNVGMVFLQAPKSAMTLQMIVLGVCKAAKGLSLAGIALILLLETHPATSSVGTDESLPLKLVTMDLKTIQLLLEFKTASLIVQDLTQNGFVLEEI